MAARVKGLNVNGSLRALDVDGDRTLLGVLREELDLTGAKYGCGEGKCGACVVLVDDEPVHACVAKVGAFEGKAITTVEGLEKNGTLHPLQQAFLDEGAFQCGYCTPGMILAGVALLRREPDPDEAHIAEALNGNVCRCGTYTRIVAAVRRAARALKGGRS